MTMRTMAAAVGIVGLTAALATGPAAAVTVSDGPAPRAAAPAGSLSNADTVPDPVPLADLVERARAENPEIAAARHRAEAAEARVPQAGALPDPTLSTGLMYVPVPDFGLSTEGMTMFSLQLSQRIPVPGSRGMREGVAAHQHTAASLEAEETELQVIARLKGAYFELAFAQEAEGILRRNRALIADLADVAGARLAVDQAPQQDVLRAQTEVSRIDEQLVGLENQRTNALTEINAILDRDPLTPLGAEYPGAVEALALGRPGPGAFTAAALQEDGLGPDFPTLGELQERALHARPGLLAHGERIRAYRGRRDVAERERWPELGWMVSYSPRVGRQDMVSFGLSVDLPLFRGRKQDQALVEAEAELADHEVRHHEMVAKIRSEVAGRYDELVRVRERLVLLDDGVIPQADATVESALVAYRTGRMEFAGLLEAQAILFRNEIERARLLADFGSALAALEAVVGDEIEPGGQESAPQEEDR